MSIFLHKKGVTLIEMLVYMSILSILIITLFEIQTSEHINTLHLVRSSFEDQEYYRILALVEEVIEKGTEGGDMVSPVEGKESTVLSINTVRGQIKVYGIAPFVYVKNEDDLTASNPDALRVSSVSFSRNGEEILMKLVTDTSSYTTAYVFKK